MQAIIIIIKKVKERKMEKDLHELMGETLIIHLPEELDHHTVGEVRNATDDLFIGKRVRNVIFDYGKTSFMDSSGIGLIMGRYREVRYLKGNVYLVNIGKKMERILEISGLYRVAIRAEDISTAMEMIKE